MLSAITSRLYLRRAFAAARESLSWYAPLQCCNPQHRHATTLCTLPPPPSPFRHHPGLHLAVVMPVPGWRTVLISALLAASCLGASGQEFEQSNLGRLVFLKSSAAGEAFNLELVVRCAAHSSSQHSVFYDMHIDDNHVVVITIVDPAAQTRRDVFVAGLLTHAHL